MNKDFIKHDEEIYVIAELSGISWWDWLFNSIPSMRFLQKTYYPLDACISWHEKQINGNGSTSQIEKSTKILKELWRAIESLREQIRDKTFSTNGSDSQ